MSTTDDLVAACIDAMSEPDPRGAVREILARSLVDRWLTDTLKHPSAGLKVLYCSPHLTVVNVVWPPLMTLFPHDHRMWAAIGIFGGREEQRVLSPERELPRPIRW